jgi:hypothetical protein
LSDGQETKVAILNIYNKDEQIDDTFLQELYDELQVLDKRGIKWLMTQADTKEVKQMFKKYKVLKSI